MRQPHGYPDVEIAPGVVITYGDGAAVYISDEQGEIVSWTYAEVEEDPDAWTASMHAVAMAVKLGSASVRHWIENGGYQGVGFLGN